MSLINKMLQDLDRRQGVAAGDGTVPPQVRPVAGSPARGGHEWFWRIFAFLMMVAVAWVLWIAYQLQPRPLATDAAFAAADSARSKASPAPVVVAVPPAPAPAPAPAAAPAPRPAPMETFKLAGQIAGEIPPERVRATAPRAEAEKPAKSEPKPAASASSAPAKLGLDVPQARIIAAPSAPGKVEKRDRTRSGSERAEGEFRRGVGLLNQGRVSEAEDGFAAALALDAAYEPARQALVSLYLEKRRTEDARRLLQEGLAINPRQQQFTAVLARIMIEARDHSAALDQIGKSLAIGPANADLLTLRGAALQRLGRHRDAAESYDASLRMAPQAGSAWLGFAISLEALERRSEAAEAYRRAAASGNLGAEAREYAEQRGRSLR